MKHNKAKRNETKRRLPRRSRSYVPDDRLVSVTVFVITAALGLTALIKIWMVP